MGPIKQGTWPERCVQRAFVEGAQWWQWDEYHSTMFGEERRRAEAEALKRFGEPAAEPEWEAKCWGRVRHLWASPDVAISYLELQAKTCSSWHVHHDRFNAFHVTAGTVIVEVEIHDLVTQVELRAGRSFTVEPGKKHRFRVIESGRMVEVYWPEEGKTCRADDIFRYDSGGEDDELYLRT